MTWVWRVLAAGWLLWASLPLPAACAASLKIYPGVEPPDPRLGFGWGAAETLRGRPLRWINHLEAEVWFDAVASRDLALAVLAMPMTPTDEQQIVAVLVNGRFVTEWRCPLGDTWGRKYAARIPARYLRDGRNRLVLRMGFRRARTDDPDADDVALAVAKIILAPVR